MYPLVSNKCPSLRGDVKVPGDKSISHRSLMFGALAMGETTVSGLLEGEDVLRTAAAMQSLGAEITREDDGTWKVRGRGVGGLSEPAGVLDMGNSGTAARLIMGLLATSPFNSFLTGDASLCARPMERVMKPLRQVGATFTSRSKGRLPLVVEGTSNPIPTHYELPVASAQVKSAVLLAGLNTPGVTSVLEPKPTRDHTETMLRHFGAEVVVEEREGGARHVSVTGHPELTAANVIVPGDPSSAAFLVAAALLVEGSEVIIRNVGMNPHRTGLFITLKEMGAQIEEIDSRIEAGEPVADLKVTNGPLKGITVPAERAPSMIDEYPVLSVVASFADGTTRMEGLEELRVKESDRLGVMARSLAACGVDVEEGEDYLVVQGGKGTAPGGASIETHLDHRIAMSFMVFGMASSQPVTVDDGSPIETSFPGFADLMNGLGAKIEGANRG